MGSPKHIILSGAGRGIGRAMARHFLSKGHLVFLMDIDESELNHTATKHLSQYSSQLASRVCNVRDVNDIRSAVEDAVKFFPNGRIHVLINNAGIAHAYWKDGATMADPATFDQWTAYVETNLTAPFALSQACIPHMKVFDEKQPQHPEHTVSPCIIHISSFRAHQSDPNQEGYASTKAGLLGLTHSMAISCARWGIRVNLVAPGKIKAYHENREGDENEDEWDVTSDDAETHPTNRAGRPEDIAEAAEYLIGASFVTGQDITVDGGASKVKTKA